MHFIKKKEPEISCLKRIKDSNLSDIITELNTINLSNSQDKSETIGKLGGKYWKKVKTGCKDSIRKSILEEQQCLCVYCEREIENNKDIAHLEHIRPKSIYLERCFDYDNLVMSCNGKECSDVNKDDYEDNIHSCGHPKQARYSEEKFLNPTELENIADYFSYDMDTGKIEASENEPTKADYMIEILNLDNPFLNNSRINAKKALLKNKEKLLNSTKAPAFISYLRYYYDLYLKN